MQHILQKRQESGINILIFSSKMAASQLNDISITRLLCRKFLSELFISDIVNISRNMLHQSPYQYVPAYPPVHLTTQYHTTQLHCPVRQVTDFTDQSNLYLNMTVYNIPSKVITLVFKLVGFTRFKAPKVMPLRPFQLVCAV